jgi:hypothetical protein
MGSSNDKTIMRSLGEFFGYIAKGVTSNPTKGGVREVSRRVEEETKDGVVLRRTTIEEVEIRDATRTSQEDERT